MSSGTTVDRIVRHPWAAPASLMVSAACLAVVLTQALGWKWDQAAMPALPDVRPSSAPEQPSAVRLSADGFIPKAAVAAPPKEKPVVMTTSKSGLPVDLLGTFVAGKEPKMSSKSVAIVQLTSGSREVEILHVGEKWQGLELLEVERGKIWVRNVSSGAREFITNEQLLAIGSAASSRPRPGSTPAEPSGGTGNEKIQLSRSQVNRALDNNSNVIFSWVDVQPHAVSGRVEGFKLNNIKPRGKPFFNLLGFREGDVVKRVNGVKMDSVDKAVGLWSSIHGQDDVSFTIERLGVEKEITLVFKP